MYVAEHRGSHFASSSSLTDRSTSRRTHQTPSRKRDQSDNVRVWAGEK